MQAASPVNMNEIIGKASAKSSGKRNTRSEEKEWVGDNVAKRGSGGTTSDAGEEWDDGDEAGARKDTGGLNQGAAWELMQAEQEASWVLQVVCSCPICLDSWTGDGVDFEYQKGPCTLLQEGVIEIWDIHQVDQISILGVWRL